MADMKGKVVVLTGGTSGIGQVAAESIAGMGARLILVARDRTRGEAALSRLHMRSPGGAHAVYYADLSRLADMKRVAKEIAAAEPRVDLLINSAGALFTPRQVTPDGLELTFATNHLSYFVLTHFLRERLMAAAPARIVNTSSEAHRRARLDFSDLQSERGYRGFGVYSRSKLANILFTRELARRLKGTEVTANSLHPGFVATRFGDNNGGISSSVMGFFKKICNHAGARRSNDHLPGDIGRACRHYGPVFRQMPGSHSIETGAGRQRRPASLGSDRAPGGSLKWG
jgi:NAD(P)-dependent dehydrogenase (short-subunit alcohol dehydrogenase family)